MKKTEPEEKQELSEEEMRSLLKRALVFYQDKDYERAFPLLLQLAEEENDVAQFVIGLCYQDGTGVKQNNKKAVMWYEASAKQGNVDAACNLADCYREGIGTEADQKEAFGWYKAAANQGDAYAENCLGTCYMLGFGVKKDEKQVEIAERILRDLSKNYFYLIL